MERRLNSTRAGTCSTANFPTLGAWVHYGLGSLNDNLPQFISMGNREYWNAKDGHYLGPAHDAVPFASIPTTRWTTASQPAARSLEEQQLDFELRGRLNQLKAIEYPNDPALLARIKAYELAFRMQTSVPEALGFDTETQATQEMYGLNEPADARLRFADAGDSAAHRTGRPLHPSPAWGRRRRSLGRAWRLKANHETNFKAVDKPVAGLLKDLKQRGLLESTIVIFATEFGRTPASQGTDGRDHHPYGFSVWMAGGGIKGGIVHGATDEIGFHAVEHRHYVTDIHATILQATRPRLPQAGSSRPQATRHRPRQTNRRDHRLRTRSMLSRNLTLRAKRQTATLFAVAWTLALQLSMAPAAEPAAEAFRRWAAHRG